jgi:aryl-alcohol dehydrogenase-like predicted oxidoreductase
MTEIEYRKLGASGICVPAVGIGTMGWGISYGRSRTREELFATYRSCLDAGLCFFDTAEGYGEAERLLGGFSRQVGRPVVIASKFDNSTLVAPSPSHSTPRSLLKALERSLQRLGVECIDLYQIHYPVAPKALDDYMDILAEAVQAGKVRAVGVSNFNAALMPQAHARLAHHGIPLASNQVGYNLLRRYAETNGILSACRELDVALIAAIPLSEGVLTGKYRTGGRTLSWFYRIIFYFAQLDLFNEFGDGKSFWKRLFAKPRLLEREKLEPLFVVMEKIAKTHEKTIAQVALNWLITTDPRIIPIPGAKNIRQASENAAALGWRLSEEERDRISQAEVSVR